MTSPTDDEIRRARERTDLVALVQRTVSLTRVGGDFRGTCPFAGCADFHVHPARQFFHCFGCQKSGEAIVFAMHAFGVTFPEAVRRLLSE